MSYDIRIKDKNNNTIILNHKHHISGGTYCIGGTDECTFNITYNYHPIFVKLFGDDGIRSIYGKDVASTQQILIDATKWLKNDANEDYWKPTEGNAKNAINGLIQLADAALKEYPEIEMIWSGD